MKIGLLIFLMTLAGVWAWKRSGRKIQGKRERRAARKRLRDLKLV